MTWPRHLGMRCDIPGIGKRRCVLNRRHPGAHEWSDLGDRVYWTGALTREQIVRELDTLGTRPTPPIAAEVAAHWTKRTPLYQGDLPTPDALIDVWVAVDDWVAEGRPAYGGWPGDKGDSYARLVSCLTAFHYYVRYGMRP